MANYCLFCFGKGFSASEWSEVGDATILSCHFTSTFLREADISIVLKVMEVMTTENVKFVPYNGGYLLKDNGCNCASSFQFSVWQSTN
ncbi:MAG: hypothetical protein NXI23_10625 [Bacteroidetes bacterium]|jgi:hypothetical protein|nr:hypothetical protein [Bacteroidota bacterium]